MNGRSHTRITHSLTNDLVHFLGPGHSAPPRPSAPAHTFITHKKTNDKILPFLSSDFSINSVGKIGNLSPNEEYLCNLFINNRLQTLSENYPPSRDWFPPYSIKAWNREAFMNDKWGRNLWGTPIQARADYAFIQHIYCSMDERKGRCAILLPHGVLNRDEDKELRRNHVQTDTIEAVIGLGRNLFYNSGLESFIFIFNNYTGS